MGNINHGPTVHEAISRSCRKEVNLYMAEVNWKLGLEIPLNKII